MTPLPSFNIQYLLPSQLNILSAFNKCGNLWAVFLSLLINTHISKFSHLYRSIKKSY